MPQIVSDRQLSLETCSMRISSKKAVINLAVDNVAIRSVLDIFGQVDCLSFTENSYKYVVHHHVCVVILTRALLIHAQSVSRVTCQTTNGNDYSSRARLVPALLFSSGSRIKHSVYGGLSKCQKERVYLRVVGSFRLSPVVKVLKTVFQTR